MSCNGTSVFGNRNQFIKIQNGDFVAIDGVNTVERLLTNDIRIPYKQILKSRIILRAGQVNYLLNHLGLGDNATFVAIKATYNASSVNEEDNYLTWNYFDDFSRTFNLGKLMVLTGNSTHRIKQIYLTNPNTKYPVFLDVMVAVIDDQYSFYTDEINQLGLSFTSLTVNNIETHIPDDSIVIWDSNVPRSPLSFIVLSNINSLERIGKLLIIDDSAVGRLFLDFTTEYDAKQANSIINYVLETPGAIIQDLSPRTDDIPPIVYFYSNVGNTQSGSPITLIGSTQSPVNTSMGLTFSTQLELGTYSAITKDMLISWLISSVNDNRDGNIIINSQNLVLYNYLNIVYSAITTTGTYSVNFSIEDIAGNPVNPNTEIQIYVI